jgi:antitoxin ParD1/3/4
MNVSLTPELKNFVSAKVGSGRYNSASEVVREALRLLEEHDRARAGQLTEFNQELGRRLASLDRGEKVDPSEFRAKVHRKSQDRRKAKGGRVSGPMVKGPGKLGPQFPADQNP